MTTLGSYTTRLRALLAVSAVLAVLALGVGMVRPAAALDLNISMSDGNPGFAPIPGTRVYHTRDNDYDNNAYDVYRYGTVYYVFDGNSWYRGRRTSGPFQSIARRLVPRVVVRGHAMRNRDRRFNGNGQSNRDRYGRDNNGQGARDNNGEYMPDNNSASAPGRYTRDSYGHFIRDDNNGQYSRDENGRYSRDRYSRDDNGRYVRDINGQFTRDDNGRYARDRYTQDVNGQYARDDNGQYSRDDNGQYTRDDLGQYTRRKWALPAGQIRTGCQRALHAESQWTVHTRRQRPIRP